MYVNRTSGSYRVFSIRRTPAWRNCLHHLKLLYCIYKMMYKTPTFAEPQQYNRPFSTGQLSAFIIQLVIWHVATPQWMKSSRSNSGKVYDWSKFLTTFSKLEFWSLFLEFFIKMEKMQKETCDAEMLENYIYCIPIIFF
jgi:hypothetical protein